jgi:hypothetical protein
MMETERDDSLLFPVLTFTGNLMCPEAKHMQETTHTNLYLNFSAHHHHHISNRQAVFSTMVLRPIALYTQGSFHDELDFLNTTTATDR